MDGSLLFLLLLLPLATSLSAAIVLRPNPNSRPRPAYRIPRPQRTPSHFPPYQHRPAISYVPVNPYIRPIPFYNPTYHHPYVPVIPRAHPRPPYSPPPNHDAPSKPPPKRPNSRRPPKRRHDHDSPPNPNAPPPNPANPPPNLDNPPPYQGLPPPNPTRYAPPSPYVCATPIVQSAHTIMMKSAANFFKGKAEQGSVVLDISVGSGVNPQILRGVLDITSELVWVQCGHCRTCERLTPRGTPTFLPDASPSFSTVGCGTQLCERVITGDQLNCSTKAESECTYEEDFYGEAQYTSGFLATETFTLGATSADGVVFGCSGNITVQGLAGGASGFLGFSRGPLSVMSQLNISGFSYFISHKDSSKSFFRFWADPACAVPAHQQPRKHSRYTPLLQAKAKQNPYLYYVNLTGVKVDGQLLAAVPAGTFDVRPVADGSGGVYLSTTLPVTYLEEAAYTVLRQELVTRIQSQGVAPVSGDEHDPLCYMTRSYEKIKVPRLALVFDGADATMDLHARNYFLPVDGGQTCLAILPSIGGSVLGSLLQAGRTITYNDILGGGGWLAFD